MSFMPILAARKRLVVAAAPLVALAFAGSAQALSTVATVSGGPTLTVTSSPSPTFSGNTYTIAATSTSTLHFTVDVSGVDLSSPTISTGNVLQSPYIGALCSTTLPDYDYAGVYLAAGGVNTTAWRPSTGAGSGTRQAGATYWANTHGAVKSAGCSSVIADQTLLSDSFAGTYSQDFTLNVCLTGSNYTITGTRQGPNGPVPYSIDLGPTPNLHLYQTAALGTTPYGDTLEQATNLTFTGISASC